MFIIHIHRDHSIQIKSFMQLGFNLSSRVTDTLESSSILMYKEMHMGNVHKGWLDAALIKWLIK
jgi:hypothetical protein